MSDNIKDPSGLYDDDFLKKREAMFADNADADIDSGRENDDTAFEIDESEKADNGFNKEEFDEAFSDPVKEKESFFSRLSKKRKRRAEHSIIKPKTAEYDIFDLDALIEEEEKKEAKKEKQITPEKKTEPEKKAPVAPHKKKKVPEKKASQQKAEPKKENVVLEPAPEISKNDYRVDMSRFDEKEEENETDDKFTDINSFATKQAKQANDSFFNPDSEKILDDDIDALLKSVGIEPMYITQTPVTPQPSYSQPTKEEPLKNDENNMDEPDLGNTRHVELPKEKPDPDVDSTRHFNLDKYLAEEVGSDTKVVPPVKLSDDTIHFVPVSDDTMHFTPVKEILEKEAHKQAETPKKQPDKKKGFMDNFRVLASGNRSDKAILEENPTGDGKGSLLDNIAPEDGENLFDAVEKAEKKKKSVGGKFKLGGKSVKAIQQKAKSERKREAFQNLGAMKKALGENQLKQKRSLMLCTIAFGISFVLFVLRYLYTPGNPLEFMFGSRSAVYIILNILTLLFAGFAGFKILKQSVISLRYLTADGDVCLLMVMFFVLLHDVIMIAMGDFADSGASLYTISACFAMFVRIAVEYINTGATISDIRTIMKSGELESMQPIDNKADAASLGYGISENGEPKIFYCANIDIPQTIEKDEQSEKDEKYYGYSCLGILLASLILGIICALRSDNNVTFITALVSCVCILAPFMKDIITAVISKKVGENLNSSGAAATSTLGATAVGNANAVAVDVSEILTADVSKFRRVPSSKMALSDAVVFTASALKGSKSILSSCFDDFLEESKIDPPVAEDVQYEEKLGISCWVADRRVLVGNRAMLIQHSIFAPTAEEEKAYSKNKKCMYLVVDGVLSATFLVDYKVRADIRKHIGYFNQTGLVLMLTSNEPCLTEETVASMLGAELAAIKLCSGKSSDIISEYRHNPSVRKENGLFCSRKRKNVLLLINGAYGLFSANKMAEIIGFAGQGFFLLMMLLAAILNITSLFNPITIIILQLCWGAVNIFVSKGRASK